MAWIDLPTDLLKDIAKRLTSIQDYISFRAVCISWRYAATFDNFDREFPQVPHLMYFFEERQERRRTSTTFLDLISNTCKISNFPRAMGYPYLSSSGWILCLRKHCVNVRLLHYIRRQNIDLPRLDTFPGNQQNSHLPIIRKMVLSRSSSDLVVMVIWGDTHQLAFCRPRDKSWTIMKKWDNPFSDIIYDDGKLYALDSGLRIVQCDIHGSNPTKILQVFAFLDDEMTRTRSHNYLVKSTEKFLIVSRYIWRDKTYRFRIFEIELKDGSYVEIRNLGRRCAFLGLNSSICAEFPESRNMRMKRNCIYFTNTIEQSRHPDTGVYRLHDKGIKKLFLRSWICNPQPSMVVPTL